MASRDKAVDERAARAGITKKRREDGSVALRGAVLPGPHPTRTEWVVSSAECSSL